jgi:hypothetical protein
MRQAFASQVEFTAAHEKMALRIGADEAAFLIDQFRTANGTKLPPVLQFVFVVFGRFGLPHAPILFHIRQEFQCQDFSWKI